MRMAHELPVATKLSDQKCAWGRSSVLAPYLQVSFHPENAKTVRATEAEEQELS